MAGVGGVPVDLGEIGRGGSAGVAAVESFGLVGLVLDLGEAGVVSDDLLGVRE